jgi:hypothetical protein
MLQESTFGSVLYLVTFEGFFPSLQALVVLRIAFHCVEKQFSLSVLPVTLESGSQAATFYSLFFRSHFL